MRTSRGELPMLGDGVRDALAGAAKNAVITTLTITIDKASAVAR